MYINWILNYLIIGILFQWFMYWVSTKLDTRYLFTHLERITLVFIWPVGVLGFLYNFVISFLKK